MLKFGRLQIHFQNDKTKYEAEVDFWKNEIKNYMEWYEGKLKSHYMTPSPKEDQKVRTHVISHSAILTWLNLHQEVKYLEDLMLDKTAFKGMKVLDIGSGPLPSALVFEKCELFCLDPLLPEYIKAGFPLHYYENVKFVNAFSEKIPITNDFFDAIVSVNAIDHVDDIYKTSLEIKRVLKPQGKVRIHAHYHKKTKTEPLELNDDIISKAFGWCKGFEKIKTLTYKKGSVVGDGEVFVVWSNFV